jgi:bifunctional DNA-binding transcriptional regulator/antitoxin component of YhaV-PrlF toxin-antitoxin module
MDSVDIPASPLLRVVDAFAAVTGKSDSTISSRLFDDGKKIAALRGGGDITLGRYHAALRWFSENWPDGAEWPADVQRPAPNRTGRSPTAAQVPPFSQRRVADTTEGNDGVRAGVAEAPAPPLSRHTPKPATAEMADDLRVTVPRWLRDDLGWTSTDRLVVVPHKDGALIRRAPTLEQLRGLFRGADTSDYRDRRDRH